MVLIIETSMNHPKIGATFVILNLFSLGTPLSAFAVGESSVQTSGIDPFSIIPYVIIVAIGFVCYHLRAKYMGLIENIKKSNQITLQGELDELKRRYDLEIQEIKNSHQNELTDNKQECELQIKQKEIEFEQEIKNKIKEATKRSNDAQRVVIKGKDAEQMAPMLPEFCSKYKPSDARFFGSPFDYIIIDGMSEFNGGQKDIKLKNVYT